jgi:hydroxyacyl-ACP dehydratase HTD2-like protein with hotdog domain
MRDQYCVTRPGRCEDPGTLRCAVCPETVTTTDLKPLYAASFAGPPQQKDNITLPNHYARYKIEPINFIGENKLDWFQGNVVKYTCRHDAKNGIEDLRKAIRYLEMYIEYLQGNKEWWKA